MNQKEIIRLEKLLEIRKKDYELFGRTPEDAKQDNEIRIKIRELKES